MWPILKKFHCFAAISSTKNDQEGQIRHLNENQSHRFHLLFRRSCHQGERSAYCLYCTPPLFTLQLHSTAVYYFSSKTTSHFTSSVPKTTMLLHFQHTHSIDSFSWQNNFLWRSLLLLLSRQRPGRYLFVFLESKVAKQSNCKMLGFEFQILQTLFRLLFVALWNPGLGFEGSACFDFITHFSFQINFWSSIAKSLLRLPNFQFYRFIWA